MNTPALMDLNQTADYLETSIRTIERQTAAGRMPGFRKLFGTQARWSRVVIDAWIIADCPADAAEFENKFRQGPPPSAK
ncbi:MAG: helix-turn-helix domain-containing protein [Planctomycetaceae bacterium]